MDLSYPCCCFYEFKFAIDGVQRCFLDAATTRKDTSSLCITRKSSSSTAALEAAVRRTDSLLHFPGGYTLVESMSPVPAVGHEEQHLTDAAETIFQRGEGKERQLGSAF